MTKTQGSAKLSQGGASLIEVLISIVIASIGLLALAGINAASLRYSKLSQYRATATMLASDITERMRANNVTTAANLNPIANYAFSATNFTDQETSLGSAPAKLCNTALITCTAAELAQADIWQWRNTTRDSLPSGSVFVLTDAGATAAADLWVAWRDVAVDNVDEDQVRTGGARECPNAMAVPDRTVRCLYFRIKL